MAKSFTNAARHLGSKNQTAGKNAIVATMNDVKVVEPIDTNEKYAFAFAPTAIDLVTRWNEGLKQVIDDGEYAQIYAKYFPGTPVPPEYTPGGSSSPSA